MQAQSKCVWIIALQATYLILNLETPVVHLYSISNFILIFLRDFIAMDFPFKLLSRQNQGILPHESVLFYCYQIFSRSYIMLSPR